MVGFTVFTVFLTSAVFAVAGNSFTAIPFLDSIAITAGTVFFHLAMRLIVGALVEALCRNRRLGNGKWFCVSEKESRFYRRIKVRKWKKHIPTYNPDTFSIEKHSLEEILQATCISEIVHEINIVLSFLPLIAAIPFGAFPVFLLTSLLAAGFDSLFVILQRYNRPRLLKAIKKGRT